MKTIPIPIHKNCNVLCEDTSRVGDLFLYKGVLFFNVDWCNATYKKGLRKLWLESIYETNKNPNTIIFTGEHFGKLGFYQSVDYEVNNLIFANESEDISTFILGDIIRINEKCYEMHKGTEFINLLAGQVK